MIPSRLVSAHPWLTISNITLNYDKKIKRSETWIEEIGFRVWIEEEKEEMKGIENCWVLILFKIFNKKLFINFINNLTC